MHLHWKGWIGLKIGPPEGSSCWKCAGWGGETSAVSYVSTCLYSVATLLWPSVGVKPNTWKKLGLESSGTPKNSEDDLEDQNTSHWGVLGVIGKVLKHRYRKCPRILDLDICSPSYGQKKGRELAV